MEEIAAYLFDNCDDFKEGHYLTLMNLLSKAHKNQQIITIPYQITEPVVYDRNYNVNRLSRMSSPIIEVTETQWIRLGQILDLNNVDNFVRQLDWIVPEGYQVTPGALYKYRFVLPQSLTANTRQKLHIMSRVYNEFHTESFFLTLNRSTFEWTKKLNIFINDF